MAQFDDPTIVGPANGVVRGDSKSMPNRGTSVGVSTTYGADLSQGSNNSMGSIHGDCLSDSMDACCPPGDGRFMSRGHSTSNPGRRMSGMGSDPMDDTTPGDEGMPGDRD